MLPRLRTTLDLMPSPVPDKPGLLIRDPFQFSDATIIVPPGLVECLTFFDGSHSSLDLREFLVRRTGQLDVSDIEKHLHEALSAAGFLEDDAFAERKHAIEQGFAEAPTREPAHAGSGYPDEPGELTAQFREYMTGAPVNANAKLARAIAAPHVSPFGGIDSYRAAYASLRPEDRDRTVIVLGTSHYGQSEHFGLTRKSFVTPLGATETDTKLVDELARAAGDAAIMEDYCHAVEHSIEFQVVFLQHVLGPRIKVVPILCGSYARSTYTGGMPEDDEGVRRSLDALGEIAAREGDRLLWVLGVDMAHMGRRYGDPFIATENRGEMAEVAQRDRARMERIQQGDAQGFWDLVRQNQDDLKWCGAAPIYTFLRAVPEVRGTQLHYQQWNIDPESVVSFAGMRFDS